MAPKAVLVGLPGSGKSTIGRRLAKALDVEMLDTDVAIEEQTGRRIPDIFATDGEEEFRRIEEGVVRAALSGSRPSRVLASPRVSPMGATTRPDGTRPW